MTQKEFMEINIPIIKEQKTICYKICDGVVIEFKCDEDKRKYKLYLNGYEVESNQNYSSYSIRNSFLYIKNNAHSFQWTSFGYKDSNGKEIYAINHEAKLNVDLYYSLKINWNDVTIL